VPGGEGARLPVVDDNVGTRRRRRPVAAAVLLMGLAGTSLTAACGTTATAGTAGSASTSGASTSGATSGTPAGTVTEDGSGLVEPLMKAWAAAYHQTAPGVTVTVAGGGSTQGIDDASGGRVDIGTSDVYLSSGDLLKNQYLLNIPLAVSAQSVIYNVPGLPAGTNLKLTGTDLADMYSGIITMWNDPRIANLNLGVTIPPVPVVPIHRTIGAGDTYIFTSYLSTQDPDWNTAVGYGTFVDWPRLASVRTADGSTNIYEACKKYVGCVSYNGVSYLKPAQALGLGEAALQNGGGHYTIPDPAAIQDELGKFVTITPRDETISMIDGPGGDGYPIINYEYAIVSTRQPSAATARQVRDFLTWVVTSGNAPSFIDQVGFQPLPAQIQELSLAQIGKIQ
jgi:phosphate transport system substrate-binding protein